MSLNVNFSNDIKSLFSKKLNSEVVFSGWIKSHRSSKKVAFIELYDGSAAEVIQVVVNPELPDYQQVAADLLTGAALAIAGKLVASQGSGQAREILADRIEVIGAADASYPLQKKEHTLEFLRDLPHLRARVQTLSAVARVRSELAFAIHDYFHKNNFFCLHAPIITTSDCEGAGSLFQILTDKCERNNPEKSFFAKAAYLSVSGQLQAETYATALRRVYTFGPTFRAENSNTTRHLAEFWMIEPEMAFCDLGGNIELAHDFLKSITIHVLNHSTKDLEFLHSRRWCPEGLEKRLDSFVNEPFSVVDYTEAVDILVKSNHKFEFAVEWGMDLQTEHEKYLVDTHFKKTVVVINYPRVIKPFYMKLNPDKKTVRAMDFLAPGLGEIIGGSQREDNLEALQDQMSFHHIDSNTYDWYCDLRRYGTVPHSGFGLGFERILMYITGMQNIRDVIPYPRYPGNAFA
jgi:asparaginyl-tRNA synthetase